MKKLTPHHIFLAKTLYFGNSHTILIPELWVRIDGIDSDIRQCIDAELIQTTDAKEFEPNSEFIISNDAFFSWLKETNFLSYTIFSEEQYKEDLPVFFDEDWSRSVSTDSMSLLGWTVNKFTEPAFLFGTFPIEPVVNNKNIIGYNIIDKSMINRYGLISNYENAAKIAKINISEDLYGEIWRPLALYVDKYTYQKIEEIISM